MSSINKASAIILSRKHEQTCCKGHYRRQRDNHSCDDDLNDAQIQSKTENGGRHQADKRDQRRGVLQEQEDEV